jgi:hypothetical protein
MSPAVPLWSHISHGRQYQQTAGILDKNLNIPQLRVSESAPFPCRLSRLGRTGCLSALIAREPPAWSDEEIDDAIGFLKTRTGST